MHAPLLSRLHCVVTDSTQLCFAHHLARSGNTASLIVPLYHSKMLTDVLLLKEAHNRLGHSSPWFRPTIILRTSTTESYRTGTSPVPTAVSYIRLASSETTGHLFRERRVHGHPGTCALLASLYADPGLTLVRRVNQPWKWPHYILPFVAEPTGVDFYLLPDIREFLSMRILVGVTSTSSSPCMR